MPQSHDPINVAIILGSTRTGRKSGVIGQWVADAVQSRKDVVVEIVDLAEHPLPHFDEPIPPIVGQYYHDHTKAWARTVARFDGFIFVTPEYNHSMPGVLKNAIDHLYGEWTTKVAGFVTYGGDGGVRAAEHLRVVLGELCVADVRSQVAFSLETDFVDYAEFAPRSAHVEVVGQMMDELVSWGRALRALRRKSA